jgi:hypothetical protein
MISWLALVKKAFRAGIAAGRIYERANLIEQMHLVNLTAAMNAETDPIKRHHLAQRVATQADRISLAARSKPH